MVKNLPANAGKVGSIPGSRRSPGEGNSSALQCSCLGNPMDKGAWQATVREVAESDMTEHTHKCLSELPCCMVPSKAFHTVQNESFIKFFYTGDFFKALIFLLCFGAIDSTLPTGTSLIYLISINLFTRFLTNGQNAVAFFLTIEDNK